MKHISRRKFITYTAASTAGLLISPTSTVIARDTDVLSLMRLHPVRFVAGLVFDIFKSVIVELAKDAIVSALYSGHRPTDIKLGTSDGMESVGDFKHPNYKASAVILGVSDYEAHRKRKLKLLLESELQADRFSKLVEYLRDEKIRIKTSEMEYSYPVEFDIEPDDLFMLDYFQMDSHAEAHYKNLIELTGSTAFREWSI